MRESTLLTREKLAYREGGMLDWDSQPSVFKKYPSFLSRTDIGSIPQLKWLRHTRMVTDVRSMGLKPYYRLNVPSAGNLHPIEIYIQLRGVPGLLSGIYHLELPGSVLTLIREIGSEGVERYVGMDNRFDGAIVMISLVPFRSFWKYGLRGWRYLYLDLGHQIGTLGASVRHFGGELSKMSPSGDLSRMMGMGDEEFVAAVYGVGSCGERPAKPLKRPLMRVAPTDYCEGDESFARALNTGHIFSGLPETAPVGDFDRLNAQRRSAREFCPVIHEGDALQRLMKTPCPPSIEPIFAVVRARSMQHGLYKKGHCVREGEFRNDIVRLLLDQRFTGSAALVALIYADRFDEQTHIDAGIYAQMLYLSCEAEGLGCSGIGAFFDEEAPSFHSKKLVYAVAIGGKP